MSVIGIPGGSVIQINRLKGGWTWSVKVEAEGNEPEQLQAAKDKALALAFELRDDIAARDELFAQDLEDQIASAQF